MGKKGIKEFCICRILISAAGLLLIQIIIALPRHTISYQASILCDSVHTMDELSLIIISVYRSDCVSGAMLLLQCLDRAKTTEI